MSFTPRPRTPDRRPYPSCPTCDGKKTIDRLSGETKSDGTPIIVTVTCPDCNGTGKPS